MREVNLRIFEFGSQHHLENELFSFFCECSEPECGRKISLHLHRFDPTMPAGSLLAHVPDGEQETVDLTLEPARRCQGLALSSPGTGQ